MADCCQVIDGDGVFQEQQLDEFVHQHGVIDARTSYQVVAIMGPQSSGKSTLMNFVVSVGATDGPSRFTWSSCGFVMLIL